MSGDNHCNLCNVDSDYLYCREGYKLGYVIEWVCKKCYEIKYGMKWTDLPEHNKGDKENEL